MLHPLKRGIRGRLPQFPNPMGSGDLLCLIHEFGKMLLISENMQFYKLDVTYIHVY